MNKFEFDFRPTGAEYAPFRLHGWGDFAILAPTGEPLNPRGRKARALLAWLAFHPDRPISRERIAGLLWGDRGEEQARASLRQALFELKAFTTGPAPLLIVERSHVRLDPAQLETDADRLQAAARSGDAAQLERALPDHDEQLFADLDNIDSGFDDWLAIERTRQRDLIAETIRHTAALGKADAGAALPATSVPAVAAPAPADRRQHWPLVVLFIALLATVGFLVGRWPPYAPPSASAPVTIAVLPFASLSGASEAYLADGVSEEILNRLARNPRLKVLGRTSAWSLQGQGLDAKETGRKLGVDYLVEGSIRSSDEQVRVNVALVDATDGTRLWSEQYAGPLDGIFSIQDRIGSGVSARLNLAEGARPETMLAARGEAYRLFLQARGMMRTWEPSQFEPAERLLRRAVALDPGYAPAWAALGTVVAVHADMAPTAAERTAEWREAVGHARRALALQPDLAAAHRALGLAAETPGESKPHFERAARLNPNDAESWADLARIHEGEGNYPATLAAWRRAVAIDPLWWPAFYYAAEWAWQMGYRDEAEAYVRRIELGGPVPFQAHMVRGDMAWRQADFSRQFAEAQKAWLVADKSQRFFAVLAMERSLRAVGRYDEASRIWQRSPMSADVLGMWNGKPPGPALVDRLRADPVEAWLSRPRMHFLLSTLLGAGRTAEIVRLYDARYPDSDAMLADYGTNATFIWHAALVARALRAEQRAADADRLLAQARAVSRRITAGGRTPAWYPATEAVLLAAEGKTNRAVEALQAGVARGWVYPGVLSFRGIGDDPAFAPIRDDPRFQQIRERFDADVAREAREMARLPSDPGVSHLLSAGKQPI